MMSVAFIAPSASLDPQATRRSDNPEPPIAELPGCLIADQGYTPRTIDASATLPTASM